MPDRDQQTLLTIVAIYGRRALVRPLVDMGADFNARDAEGYPIYWACCMGHSGVALELAALGADPTVNVSVRSPATSCLMAALIDDSRDVDGMGWDGMGYGMAGERETKAEINIACLFICGCGVAFDMCFVL